VEESQELWRERGCSGKKLVNKVTSDVEVIPVKVGDRPEKGMTVELESMGDGRLRPLSQGTPMVNETAAPFMQPASGVSQSRSVTQNTTPVMGVRQPPPMMQPNSRLGVNLPRLNFSGTSDGTIVYKID
jgi:hypothetical protein